VFATGSVGAVPPSAGVGRTGDAKRHHPFGDALGGDSVLIGQTGHVLDLDDELVIAGAQVGGNVEVAVEKTIQAPAEQAIDLGRPADFADDLLVGVADGDGAGQGGFVEGAALETGEVAQLDVDLDEVAGPLAGAGLEGVIDGQRIVVPKTVNPLA